MEALLSVKNLKVGFPAGEDTAYAVNGVSLDIRRGETLALVGESGCGKSLTAYALMGLLTSWNNFSQVKLEGSIQFSPCQGTSQELLGLPDREFDQIRGKQFGMIFQEPMTSLNPVLTVRYQLCEPLRKHRKLGRKQALEQAVELLRMVGIPEAEKRIHQYPHQFSGGQRQRIMIAIAIACNCQLLIADEPTTALDVTIQAQVLDVLWRMKQHTGMSLLLITHNLGMVASFADRVAVMYSGEIVETGSARDIFLHPAHPYTRLLLAAVPRLGEQGGTRKLASIGGIVPLPSQRPKGCAFSNRCPYATPSCSQEHPGTIDLGGGHLSCCQRKGEML